MTRTFAPYNPYDEIGKLGWKVRFGDLPDGCGEAFFANENTIVLRKDDTDPDWTVAHARVHIEWGHLDKGYLTEADEDTASALADLHVGRAVSEPGGLVGGGGQRR